MHLQGAGSALDLTNPLLERFYDLHPDGVDTSHPQVSMGASTCLLTLKWCRDVSVCNTLGQAAWVCSRVLICEYDNAFVSLAWPPLQMPLRKHETRNRFRVGLTAQEQGELRRIV